MPANKSRVTRDADDGLFEPFKVIRKNGLVIVQDLPLVDEHTVFDEEGEFVCECDTQMLTWIASNNNKRVRETGDEVPVTIGHTIDDAPEHKQPVVVGYSRDFYVAPLVNAQTGESTGRNCIYARKTTFTEEDVVKHDLKRYGRRSVEIWFDKDPIIDPIALLSSTTPERDLGILRLCRKGKKLRCGEMGMIGCRIPKPIKRQRFGNITNYPSDQDDLVGRILAELMNSEPMKFLADLQNDPGMMEAYLATHMPQPNMDMLPEDPGAGMSEDLDQNMVPDVMDQVNGPMAPARNQRRPVRYEADDFADDMGTTLNGGGDMTVQMSRNGNSNTHAPRIQNAKGPAVSSAPPARRPAGLPVRHAKDKPGIDEGDLDDEAGDEGGEATDEADSEVAEADDSSEGGDDLPGDDLDMTADEFASEDDLPDMVDEADGFQEDEMEATGGEFAEEVADVAMEEEGGHMPGHSCPHCGGAIEITEEVFAPGDESTEEGGGVAMDEFEEEEDVEIESPIRHAAQAHEVGGNPEHPRGSMFRTPGGRLPQTPPRGEQRPHNVGGRTPASATVNMPPMESAYANSGRRPGDPENFAEHEPRRHARQGEPVQRKKLTMPEGQIHQGKVTEGLQHNLPKKPIRNAMSDTTAGTGHKMQAGMSAANGMKPVKRSMGGSTASGTNGFIPSGAHTDKAGKKSPAESDVNQYQNPGRLKNPEEVEHLSRRKVKRMRTATQPVNTAPQGDLSPEDVAALRDRLDRMENENHALRNELGNLKHNQGVLVRNAKQRAFRERLQRRRSELILCENEGIDLDINEEMGTQEEGGDAFTMNEGQWSRKIDGIRKRYSKSIATSRLPFHPHDLANPASRQQESQTPAMRSKDDVWAAVKAAQAAGNSVEEQKAAYRKINGVA